MTAIRLIARPMLASVFIVGAASALKNAPKLATKASRVTEKVVPLVQRAAPGAPIPTDPVTIVRVNAVVQIAAASALATGRMPRLSSTVLAMSHAADDGRRPCRSGVRRTPLSGTPSA